MTVIAEVAEEDGVDGHAIGLCEKLDDAIRSRVKFGSSNRELLFLIDNVRQRAIELLGEGLIKLFLTAMLVEVDLLEILKAQALYPGSIVKSLSDDVPGSEITL